MTEPIVRCQAPGGSTPEHTCICDLPLEEGHEVHVCRCGAEWAVLHQKEKGQPMERTLMGDVEAVLNNAQRKIARQTMHTEMMVAHIEALTGCSHEVAHLGLQAAFEVFSADAQDRGVTLNAYMSGLGQDERWIVIGLCLGRISAQLEP